MKAEYLLKKLTESDIIKVPLNYIHEMPEFKKGYDVASLESLAFTLDGHAPIREYRFDVAVLSSWCEKNNLIYALDEKENVLHLKNKDIKVELTKWRDAKPPKLLDCDFSEENSLMSKIEDKLNTDIRGKLDTQIIDILKNNGYIFENRAELEYFAKTRCSLVSSKGGNRKVLMVDNKELCEWYDDMFIDYENNKFTATFGIRIK